MLPPPPADPAYALFGAPRTTDGPPLAPKSKPSDDRLVSLVGFELEGRCEF
jgi:hypothetical protein